MAGFFYYWEVPSLNLASQTKNLSDNARNKFFYKICSIAGEVIYCLKNKDHSNKDHLKKCEESYGTILKLVSSEEITQHFRNNEHYKNAMKLAVNSINQRIEEDPSLETDKVFWFKTIILIHIDYITKNVWPKCREVAGIK